MTIKTFPGGIHPPTLKELTSTKTIKVAPLPKKVILPLVQHTGTPCKPKVKVGEYVRRGQLIAETEAFITSPIHASISGVVKGIDRFPHPTLGEGEAMVIEGDGRDAPHEDIISRDVDTLSSGEMLDIIKRHGIVGLGGAAFPTHVKLMPPEGNAIDTVLLNGVECEPYLSCDHRLMLEKPEEIIKGLFVIMKILRVKKAYIAIEDNKLDAVSAMKSVVSCQLSVVRRNTQYAVPSYAKASEGKRSTQYDIRIVVLKTKYPQGGEKQLIKTVLGREVPPEKLPFEVGCVVSNVATAYAIYEAIYENKPLYERVVTVSGSSIREPQNLLVRVGTLVSDLIDVCGGFKNEVEKAVVGGPMMGITQCTLEVPVVKGVGGIVFLSKKEAEVLSELPCIKCGRCIDVCPVNLIPTRIYQFVKKEKWEKLKSLNPLDCVECGACSYDCPSKISLLHYIRVAKIMLSRNQGVK